MPTENRSSNTEMVSVPREQLDKWETCLLAHDLHGIADEVRGLLAQPAAPHQSEPVAEIQWTDDAPEWQLRMLVEIACGPSSPIKLYTHADAGEVEQLRNNLRQWLDVDADRLEVMGRMRAELDSLRAQLTERDALLRNSAEVHDAFAKDIEADKRGREQPKWLTEAERCMRYMSHRINAALSASAEPKS